MFEDSGDIGIQIFPGRFSAGTPLPLEACDVRGYLMCPKPFIDAAFGLTAAIACGKMAAWMNRN
jgi:hypothetical protein